jgi:aryl-alcohol dehydrogenase-like predicted oxidoreductase
MADGLFGRQVKNVRTRVLGRTGLEVSEIGFGAVEIGIEYGLGTEGKRMPSEEEAIRLVKSAVDKGINLFDTARAYGESERRLGLALKGIRDNIVIGTKVQLHGKEGKNHKDTIIASVHKSLETLNTHYIDILQMHDAGEEDLLDSDIHDAIQELKKEGKIRFCGISTYSPEIAVSAVESDLWDVVQVAYSALYREMAEKVFPLCAQRNVGIITRSAFFKGLLTPKGKLAQGYLKSIYEEKVRPIELIADDKGSNIAQIALRFALSSSKVSSVLIGIARENELLEGITAADIGALPAETIKQILEIIGEDVPIDSLKGW